MLAEARLTVPRQMQDITPDWLTQALQKRFPGVAVRSVGTGTEIHGTATKLQLLVDYAETGGGNPPSTMWYKGGLEQHSFTDDMLIVYAAEAAFYRDLADEISITIPKALAAHLDETNNHSFVILEDLLTSGATFGHVSRPVTPDRARQFVVELARLHSRFWNSEQLRDTPWLKGGGSLLQSCEVLMSEATWERCQALPRGQFVRGRLKDFTTMREGVLRALRTDAERAHCLVHGDSHIGNTYQTASGGCGFLDWQSTSYGFWAHDVTYFLITALTIEDRRACERDLLRAYLEELRANGVVLAEEEAWLEYRRHAIYCCSWSMCLPEWQTEETCRLVTERAITAAEDLDALAAWEGGPR